MSGGQGFSDPGVPVTAENKLDFHVRQAMNEISTSTPVQIVRAPYDRNGNAITPGSVVPIGFVDVQPLVNQQNADGTNTPHQTVYQLSYHRFQGGYGAIISDPKVGDQGLMMVADTDTSTVKQNNAQGPAGSARRFDKADGTFFGCTQGSAAPSQYITFTSGGIVIADGNGNSITLNSSGVTIKTNGTINLQKGSDTTYGVTTTNGNSTVVLASTS